MIYQNRLHYLSQMLCREYTVEEADRIFSMDNETAEKTWYTVALGIIAKKDWKVEIIRRAVKMFAKV